MLMLLFFQHSPPPSGRPFAGNWANRINSPHRCNNGRTGRDVPRTNIYTGIMAPDSRGVYNKSTQYCPFITRRRCARCMSAYTYTCIIILCRRVCLGIGLFFFFGLYDWFCFTVTLPTFSIRRDGKTRFHYCIL